MALRYLSLFSGIEAVSCAWRDLPFEPVAFSEIEKFPCNVLATRYPGVPNLGDITKITRQQLDDLGQIDLIVGGSPCQGFSVAGTQQGLKDERSALAVEYIRIINYVKPAWIVWENVPGVLSTNGGMDFRLFTAALTKLGYSIGWRVLDAQYFGVPQRRRRIFLVGYSGARGGPTYPAEVLFECESLPGYLGESGEKGENPAGVTASGVGTTGDGVIAFNSRMTPVSGNVSGPLDCLSTQAVCYDMTHACDAVREYTDKTPTLQARMGTGGNQVPLCLERQFFSIAKNKSACLPRDIFRDPPVVLNDQGGGRMAVSDKSMTLRAQEYGHQPVVMDTYRIGAYASNSMMSDNPNSGVYATDKSNTLQANDPTPACRQGGIAVVQGSVIGRSDKNGPQGSGVNMDVCFTLNTTDRHAVTQNPCVRKLTPLECLRLQGFPDDYFDGVPGYSDTAAYKAIGNSMAVPVMRWIGRRILACSGGLL